MDVSRLHHAQLTVVQPISRPVPDMHFPKSQKLRKNRKKGYMYFCWENSGKLFCVEVLRKNGDEEATSGFPLPCRYKKWRKKKKKRGSGIKLAMKKEASLFRGKKIGENGACGERRGGEGFQEILEEEEEEEDLPTQFVSCIHPPSH